MALLLHEQNPWHQYDYLTMKTVKKIAETFVERKEEGVRHYSTKNCVIAAVGSQGAHLSFSDNSATLDIPEGALSELDVIYCLRDVQQATKGGSRDENGRRLVSYSPVFKCGPDGLKFAKPATLRFRHSISRKSWNNKCNMKVYQGEASKSKWKSKERNKCRIDGEWMEISLNGFGEKPEAEREERGETETKKPRHSESQKTTLGSKMVRKVPVLCGTGRRLVEIDFSDFKKTMEAIEVKWNMSGEFVLQAASEEKRDYFDIVDDGDLAEFKGVEELVVRPVYSPSTPTASAAGWHSCSGQGLGEGTRPPPSYQQSQEPNRSRVTVHHCTKRKMIVVEKTRFEQVHSKIANRFSILGDFQLIAKDAEGTEISIDDDDDLRDNEDFVNTLWVVQTEEVKDVAKRDEDTVVSIGKETFSLIKPPELDSLLVIGFKDEIQTSLNIPLLSRELGMIADCLRIAYYGTVSDPKIQTLVQDLQFEFMKVCGKCDTAVLKMNRDAGDAMHEMICGFGYLLDGFDDFGMERLGDVAGIAAGIVESTQSVVGLLVGLEEKVTSIINKITKQRGDRGIREREQQLKENVDGALSSLEGVKESLETAKEKVEDLAGKEQRAIEGETKYLSYDSGVGYGLKKMFTFGLYQGSTKLAEQQERLASQARADHDQEEDKRRELRQKEIEAYHTHERFTFRLEEHRRDPAMMTDKAVHAAKSGIKPLKSTVEQIIAFWEQKQDVFASIGRMKNLRELEQIKERRGDTRKFWKSHAFKTEAMRELARFVAVQKMCGEVRTTMTGVLESIHLCVKDNPTREEAEEKISELLERFRRRVDARKALEAREEREAEGSEGSTGEERGQEERAAEGSHASSAEERRAGPTDDELTAYHVGSEGEISAEDVSIHVSP